jgi:hypothetical protein
VTESPVAREIDLDSEHIISTYVDDARFLRRVWLTNLIRQHLDDPSCRFVLLTGAPGTGKTSFIASLTTEFDLRREISPFTVRPPHRSKPTCIALRRPQGRGFRHQK